MLGRLLNARDIVLWMLVTPICVLSRWDWRLRNAMDAYGRHGRDDRGSAVRGAWSRGLAWCPVSISSISLAERWRARRSWWHMWGRWLALVLLPYIIVPGLAVLTLLPSYVFWTVTGRGQYAQLDDLRLAVGGLLTLAISLAMWKVGRRISLRLVRKHAEYLRSDRADPSSRVTRSHGRSREPLTCGWRCPSRVAQTCRQGSVARARVAVTRLGVLRAGRCGLLG